MKNLFDAPIPGQSLTQDKDSPMPYETPPEFAKKDEAFKTLFKQMMKPKSIEKISSLMQDGASIEAMTKIILTTGIVEGKINPDMKVLLAEPVAMSLLHIAGKLGIQPVMYEDDWKDKTPEEEFASLTNKSEDEVQQIKEKIPEPTSLLTPKKEEDMTNAQ